MRLLIHGGAGVISQKMNSEREQGARQGLHQALCAGWRVLEEGGGALDACCAAVCVMEDNPHFNAGRGSTFHLERGLEMEATVMRGVDRACGAVTGIWGPRYPVLVARAIMEKTPHIMLGGEGAMAFCRQQGIEMKPQEWFKVPARLQALEQAIKQQTTANPGSGTVGAVALDGHHNLAAATSTGGRNAKMFGRIGDSACVGAGTWADNRSCAVSGTGHGESFIRLAVGHELDARIRLGGQNVELAAQDIITEMLQAGGSGGLIAIGADGRFAMPFNCEGMFRGTVAKGEAPRIAIFREELGP